MTFRHFSWAASHVRHLNLDMSMSNGNVEVFVTGSESGKGDLGSVSKIKVMAKYVNGRINKDNIDLK